MEDERILELYRARREEAIAETADKYGRYCHAIAYRILQSDEDCKECVNDAYMRVWDSIPPHCPAVFKAFLGKIVRNLALDRYDRESAKKRGEGQLVSLTEELQDCLPAAESTERIVDDLALAELVNSFLASLSVDQRKIFLQRYWYFRTVKEIAAELRVSEGKVKMILMRARNRLKQYLEKEGVSL